MIVCPYFPPRIGGAENYIYNIARGLNRRYGWNIVIVTTNQKNKKIYKEQKEGGVLYHLPVLFTFSNTPINPLWYFQIKKLIADEKPDIINAHSPVPFMADMASLASHTTPFVLTYHAGSMLKDRLFFDIVINLYEKMILPLMFRNAKRIICASTFVKRTIVKNYIDKAIAITPGVDSTMFTFNPNIKKESHSVLFVGRHANMYRMKGLFYLIEAVQQGPGVQLKIIGEKIPLKLKNISFIGVKKGRELVTEIQKATILVLPSLAHMESFGMVLIEAMACKTSVIGTNIGGIPEVINHNKDGIIVPPKDSFALKQAIEKIIKNKVLAKTMREHAYKKVHTQFTWEKKVDQTANVFLSLLKTP